MNEATAGCLTTHSTGKPDLHFSPPDLGARVRISQPNSLVLKFGTATLKCALDERDSDCFTVPKKAVHSRASDLRFHPSESR